MATVNLRPPTREQMPQLVELDRRCLGGIWSLDGYQREWDSPNSELIILAQSSSFSCDSSNLADEKIIACGCFWAILEEAHITLLMVDPDYQGQGWGKSLLYALLQGAVDRHLERATLEVRASNAIAIALYEKFGFVTLGRRKRYYAQTGEDALILWRNGLQQPAFQEQLATWREIYGDHASLSPSDRPLGLSH